MNGVGGGLFAMVLWGWLKSFALSNLLIPSVAFVLPMRYIFFDPLALILPVDVARPNGGYKFEHYRNL